VHTTATMRKTLDPSWRLEKVKVRVSNDGQSAVFAEKEQAIAFTGSGNAAADAANNAADATLEVSKHKGGTNVTSPTTVVGSSATATSAVNNLSVWEQGLVVEVYDMDMGRRGSFLGRVALSTEEVISLGAMAHVLSFLFFVLNSKIQITFVIRYCNVSFLLLVSFVFIFVL